MSLIVCPSLWDEPTDVATRLRAVITEYIEARDSVEAMRASGDGTAREWDRARRRYRAARNALNEEAGR